MLPEFCFGRKAPIFALQKPAKLAVTFRKASQKQIPAKAGRVWEITASSGTSKNQYSINVQFCIVGLFLVSDFCALLIFTDLTKNHVGGILKKKGVPDSIGRLHIKR